MTDATILSRPFQDEQDFWHIRELSIQSYAFTGLGFNWDFRRWDGSRFHNPTGELNPNWAKTIQLWITSGDHLAGAANLEGPGWFSLQINPVYRAEIEEAMLDWVEEHGPAPDDETGQSTLQTEVFDHDCVRRRLLEARGFIMLEDGGVIRRMYLVAPSIPEAPLAEGYTLAEVNPHDLHDCQRMADLLNAAFNRTKHNALEFQQFGLHAPSYRQDLHLVAVAPDGSYAAHVAAIFDSYNHRAIYEPVCTHPDHRRKSLAQSLMYEAMRRVKALGAIQITVDTGDMIPANKLYDSMGFTEAYKSHVWKKTY